MMKKDIWKISMITLGMAFALSTGTFAEEGAPAGEEAAAAEMAEAVEEEGTEMQLEELGDKPSYNALDYVTLGDYTGLAVTIDDYAITEDMVESALWGEVENGIEQYELYDVDKESAVQDGDTVNIEYVGKINGEEFEGGSTLGESEDLVIGDGMFIEGFEEQLVGAKPGETVQVKVNFPEDYGIDELNGKEAVFDVTVNFIKRLPELTDDLISKITEGEYTTIESFREYQRKALEASGEEDNETRINDEIMTQLYNICEINDYPQDLVDYSIKSVKNYYIEMAQTLGMSFEELMGYGFEDTGDNFEDVVYDDVINDLQQEMIIKAIAEKEGLAVTDEEYHEGCQHYADMYGLESAEEFESYYDHDTIEQALLTLKVLDFVRASAVVEIVPVEEETDLFFDESLMEMLTEDFEDMTEIDFIDLDEEMESDVVIEEVNELETEE